MNKKYLIADLLIKISGVNDAYMDKMLKPYVHQTLKKPDIVIRTYSADDFIENKYDSVKQIGESQYFHEGDVLDSIIFYDEKMCRIVALIQFNKSYTEVDVTVCKLEKLCGINCDKLLFNVIGIAMHYLIRMKDGFVLHSSAISVNGRGVAFSAQSGVGKSTHTAMWLENVPDVTMVNDDTPVLRVADGRVNMYGSPWAGTSGFNTNIGVPLDSVVFLSQSSQNSIRSITTIEAIKLFLDGVRPSVSGVMHLKTLDTLEVVMKNVKMYHLSCNTDIEAVWTVKNNIV